MKAALDWLGSHDSKQTYDIALRRYVWSLAGKSAMDPKTRQKLRQDVEALFALCLDGGYSYTYRLPGHYSSPVHGDNSNAQYAVLGAAAAAARDPKLVGANYWGTVLKHWLAAQNADGGWTYEMDIKGQASQRSTGTMTCAGITSTLACVDNLPTTPAPVAKSLEGGLTWLNKNFDPEGKGGTFSTWALYYYYSIERVGLAAGVKRIGEIDWYKTLGGKALNLQQADGSWFMEGGWGGGDAYSKVVGTSYALLFLAHGRQPVLFNKLKFAGTDGRNIVGTDWNARPRDLAHLLRLAGREPRANRPLAGRRRPGPGAGLARRAPPVHQRLPGAQSGQEGHRGASDLRAPGRDHFQLRREQRQGVPEGHPRGLQETLPGIRDGPGRHDRQARGQDPGVHDRQRRRPLVIHTDEDLSKRLAGQQSLRGARV